MWPWLLRLLVGWFVLGLDHHVDARSRHADIAACSAAGVDDLALGVIDDLLAFEGVAFLDHLGLVDQHDAFVGGEVLDGQAVGLDDLLVGGWQLLVISRLADGGKHVDIARRGLGDGHGVARDLQRALSDNHGAAVHGHTLLVVKFGAVGLNPDRLFAIRWQGPGADASERGAETEKKGEGFNEPHADLLHWTAGASCRHSSTLSFLVPWSPHWRRRF